MRVWEYEMLVQHVCYYLTDWSGITPRQQDYDCNKIVKCLKGDTVKGYATLSIDGNPLRLDNNNKQQFLQQLWSAIGRSMNAALKSTTALVPIPNSSAIVGSPADYRTLGYAHAIAVASSGKIVAVDALQWKKEAEAAHKQKGFRTPERRYENLTVVDCPKLPIILFDDVITSGSSFIAAYWRLNQVGNTPTGAM